MFLNCHLLTLQNMAAPHRQQPWHMLRREKPVARWCVVTRGWSLMTCREGVWGCYCVHILEIDISWDESKSSKLWKAEETSLFGGGCTFIRNHYKTLITQGCLCDQGHLMYSFGSRRSNMTKTWQKQRNCRFTTFPRTKCLSERFILTSRLVMFVEGIQWASLEIWGHCVTMSPDWNQSQRLWRVFGNCLQYPSTGSLILSPTVLISMQIISLVWVTGWKYSDFRPHDPNINFWDREFPQLFLG